MKKLIVLALMILCQKASAQTSTILYSSNTFSVTLQGQSTAFVQLTSTQIVPNGISFSSNGVTPDLVVSSIGFVTIGNSITTSSRTFMSGTNATSLTNLNCPIAGSTVTLVLASTQSVDIIFNGSSGASTANNAVQVGALMDGQPFDGETSALGFTAAQSPTTATYIYPTFFYHRQNNVPAGTHSWCLAFDLNTTGTATIYCSVATGPGCTFEVRTVP